MPVGVLEQLRHLSLTSPGKNHHVVAELPVKRLGLRG